VSRYVRLKLNLDKGSFIGSCTYIDSSLIARTSSYWMPTQVGRANRFE
jgi:hypothetical protein